LKSPARKTLAVAALPLIAIATVAFAKFSWSSQGEPRHTKFCVSYQLEQEDHSLFGYAEFPTTELEYEHGMKHRTRHPIDAAMLFDMGGYRNVAFWMQDTPAPLDLAFFDTNGVLRFLAEGNPLSEELISAPSEIPIAYVLELPAGRADQLDLEVDTTEIAVGDPEICRA
jgi:uncharacterized membrane protein (UPF0127 family)